MTSFLFNFQQMIPIRWLPSEAAVEDEFSTKSDVWSFAVLIWEVVHQAALPLSHLSNEHILSSLERGDNPWTKSELDKVSPRGLQRLMTQCLDSCPRDRPNFSTIVAQLSEIFKETIQSEK
jgi:PTK7 protein tyrosine kinase 7